MRNTSFTVKKAEIIKIKCGKRKNGNNLERNASHEKAAEILRKKLRKNVEIWDSLNYTS